MSDRRVTFSPQFTRDFKRLRKAYLHIADDVQPLVEQLTGGEIPGDQVPGVGRPVYKVRIQNRSARSGKRGGFRVLYYLRTSDAIVLLTIYSKTERENISPKDLQQLLNDVDNE